ncbi:MAG: DUF4166 domain-containing protein [Alphaproteobacteria bacterium]|nr:DUF4166 domain-containing protein [Alphaproteobacteria bacterium]
MNKVLLKEILGSKFDLMPEAVKEMHSIQQTKKVQGTAKVVGGKNPIAKIIQILARLPAPTRRVPVRINFIKRNDSEEWDRLFGNNPFHTIMKKEGPYLAECLVAFPVTFVYEVMADQKGFSLHVVKVRFLGIPLPRFMQPSLAARAGEWRGRYRFSTWVGFWFCGRVISYFGYLEQ